MVPTKVLKIEKGGVRQEGLDHRIPAGKGME